jgi:hypothetical protein
MFEQEQLELLRSVLARAYEKRQPLSLRLMNKVKKHIVPRAPRKPIIEGLNIIDGETSCSSHVSGGEYPVVTKWTL